MSIKRQTNNNASLQMREGRDSQLEKHSGTHVKTKVIPQGVEISMPSILERGKLSYRCIWKVVLILIVLVFAYTYILMGIESIRAGDLAGPIGVVGVGIIFLLVGILLGRYLLEEILGREKIIILDNSLAVGKYLFGTRNLLEHYDITRITNIRVADRKSGKQGEICFEYNLEDETQTITLCKDISSAEAKELVGTLTDMLSFRCHAVKTIIFGAHPPIERYPSTSLQNPDVSDLSTPFFHLKQVVIQIETYDVQQVERFLTYASNYPEQEYLKAAVNVHIYGDPDKLHPDLRKNFEKLCKDVEVHEKDLSEVKNLESTGEPLHTLRQQVKIRTTHRGVELSKPFITYIRVKLSFMFFGLLCCSGGIGSIILGMVIADMRRFEWGNLKSLYFDGMLQDVFVGIGVFGIIGFVAIACGCSLLAPVFRKQKIVISQGEMTIGTTLHFGRRLFRGNIQRKAHIVGKSGGIISTGYKMRNIHNVRFDVEHTFQTVQTYHLLFDYGRQTIRCCEGISRDEAKQLVTLLSDILTFHCHSVERIIFGTYQRPEPDPYTTLQNPDVSELTTPFFHLKQVVIHAETYDFRLVERFLTYAINSIGKEFLKKNVEVDIYGDAGQLHPNLRHSFENFCKEVHIY